MTAPLLIGSNIINLNAWDLHTYSHQPVILINQDPLAHQGIRVAGGELVSMNPGKGQSTFNVWSKALSKGRTALILLNNAESNADVSCNAACFKAAGLTSASYTLVDAWTALKIGIAKPSQGWTSRNLKALGGSQLLVLFPAAAV
jgi:hypothetical protein